MGYNCDLLVEMIEELYKNGGFKLTIDNLKFLIRTDIDGSLIYYIAPDNKNFILVNDENRIKTIYVTILLTLTVSDLMYASLNKLDNVEKTSSEAKQKSATLLTLNFFTLSELLKNNSSLNKFEVIKKCKPANLDELHLIVNRIAYKESVLSDFIDENKYIIKKENISLEVVKEEQEPRKEIDTRILKDAEIAYEFIDERESIVNPAVGRESEIRKLGSILLTPSYSAMLIGEPGVGKTAIVEGLSYAIQNGLVSDRLKNTKILKVNVSSIVSGTMYVGSLEKKMEALIEFLKANKNVILYVDEIHTIIGAGTGSKSNIDVANLLKPHIENGSIKVIGATTIGEYDKIMSSDPAFTRRFKQVSVDEPQKEILRSILDSNITKFEEETGIKFSSSESVRDRLIEFIIDVTDIKHRSYLEKRYNPALSLSIIEEAFGYADYDMAEEVGVNYIKEAIKDCENLYKSAKAKVDRLDISDEKSKGKIIEFKTK